MTVYEGEGMFTLRGAVYLHTSDGEVLWLALS